MSSIIQMISLQDNALEMNLIDMRISNSNSVLLSCRYTVSRRTHVWSGLFHRTQFGGNAVQDGTEHKNSSHVHPSAKVHIDFLSKSLRESPPLPSSQVLRCYQKFLRDPAASSDGRPIIDKTSMVKAVLSVYGEANHANVDFCRSDIFELFDLVMILSRGNMVYFGKASEMVPYFTSIGHPCPPLTNPCDFYGE